MTTEAQTGYQQDTVVKKDQDRATYTITLDSGLTVEAERLNEAVTAVDVRSLFPPEQMHLIEAASRKIANPALFQGGDIESSLEGEDFTTAYDVITGDQVRDNLPYLWNAYHGDIRHIVSAVAGNEVFVDTDPTHGINVNVMTLATQKDGYEKHVDYNEWTGLLAGTDIHDGDGGGLLHYRADEPDQLLSRTQIRAGFLYVFKGNEHPHKVERLEDTAHIDMRITIPMDYNSADFDLQRPDNMGVIHKVKDGPITNLTEPSSLGTVAARGADIVHFPTPNRSLKPKAS